MEFQISVRHMVEFIYRSGDIKSSGAGVLSKDAMNAGNRIHKKIQKSAGSYYKAEVPLKIMLKKGRHDTNLIIDGRADGIIDKREKEGELSVVTIDEIKGVYKNVRDLEEPEFIHMAQAMCYAYIYAVNEGLSEIDVRITYANLETEEIQQFVTNCTFEYLEKWFNDTVDKLMTWVDFTIDHEKKRNESIEKLEFPYEYRKGQKDMAACVYKAIDSGKRLFIQAPTGIGKTMAAVFPTIKAFSTGLASKMFYLTAKTIAHTVANNSLDILRGNGMFFSSVTITAKEKICPMEETECDGEICPYAKGHYDRINEALFDIINHEEKIDRETVLSYAEKYMVCPYELCLDATLFADGIICDYNYVFDPQVNMNRFLSQMIFMAGRFVFLVDEAHNLVDRASSMYSVALIKEDFLALKNILKKYNSHTARAADNCNREMLRLKKECVDSEYKELDDISELYIKLLTLKYKLESFLEEHAHIPEKKEVLEFYFNLTSFLCIGEFADSKSYVTYDEILQDGRFMVKLYCVHPAENLNKCLIKGVATVFFSATILPVKYYMEMLSNDENDVAIYIPSPFDSEKRRILVGTDVTTRYTKRTTAQYENIYKYILAVTESHRGNYMIFFPSYKMMESVYEIAIRDDALSKNIMLQKAGMTEKEREDFLTYFEKETEVLAFCIMGGIFSEGIDLTGDKLIGAVVVGPGLPQVSNERKIMMDFFNKRNGHTNDGFNYAYLYPGINKVFQAAGRVIRTEDDRGIILLLDERFCRREYNSLFPIEWEDVIYCNRQNVTGFLEDFWQN